VLARAQWNIEDSQQFVAPSTEETNEQFVTPSARLFFMRVEAASRGDGGVTELEAALVELAQGFEMDVRVYETERAPAVLVLVSRLGHCLSDLLYRESIGALGGSIAAVVSDRADLASLAAAYAVPFHHLPVSDANRREQEETISELAEDLGVTLIVLANYARRLSHEFVGRFEGRLITIRQAFLPSFEGVRPYEEAYQRGVKLVGATAHYVVSQRDEGPIIDQEVLRIDHRSTVNALQARGRSIECITLARAVEAHLSHRVMLNGRRTVVFR
jgi:formyltetrahydrofolate deformylase